MCLAQADSTENFSSHCSTKAHLNFGSAFFRWWFVIWVVKSFIGGVGMANCVRNVRNGIHAAMVSWYSYFVYAEVLLEASVIN